MIERARNLVHLSTVLLHVGNTAKQALLLAAPQNKPDRARGLYADLGKDSRRFHRRSGPCAVVGTTLRLVPTIQVTADDDDLIGLLRARDLGDDVV